VVLSSAGLAALLVQTTADAGVPPLLMHSTVHAAASLAAGQATVEGIFSAKVLSLSNGVLKAMLLSKLKLLAVSVVPCFLVWQRCGAVQVNQVVSRRTKYYPCTGEASADSASAPQAGEKQPTHLGCRLTPNGKSWSRAVGREIWSGCGLATQLPDNVIYWSRKTIIRSVLCTDGKLLAAGG